MSARSSVDDGQLLGLERRRGLRWSAGLSSAVVLSLVLSLMPATPAVAAGRAWSPAGPSKASVSVGRLSAKVGEESADGRCRYHLIAASQLADCRLGDGSGLWGHHLGQRRRSSAVTSSQRVVCCTPCTVRPVPCRWGSGGVGDVGRCSRAGPVGGVEGRCARCGDVPASCRWWQRSGGCARIV